jgi:hypothetical protein
MRSQFFYGMNTSPTFLLAIYSTIYGGKAYKEFCIRNFSSVYEKKQRHV